VGVVVAIVVVLLGVVQFASDGLYASAAAPGAFPSHVSPNVGLRVYRLLARVAPAAYVESTLASAAVQRGAHAVQLEAGPVRNELLARIALARGQEQLATEYFFVAPDPVAVEAEVRKLMQSNMPAAADLEHRFRERLIALGTHPDLVAESYWHSGQMQSWMHHGPEAMRDFQAAAALAPLDMKYVLSAGNQALLNDDLPAAERYFRMGRSAAPGSAEFVAGLGLAALREGRRSQALAYLARARAMDPHAAMVDLLAHALR
jgi:tetratricopeptide (TPR) repeat protein